MGSRRRLAEVSQVLCVYISLRISLSLYLMSCNRVLGNHPRRMCLRRLQPRADKTRSSRRDHGFRRTRCFLAWTPGPNRDVKVPTGRARRHGGPGKLPEVYLGG